ncbi:endo-1,4-beta-xylanase [Fibrobacter sp.]|uniref:endo-1,4-beta-xylanase n=1 Tax=Fibrobacter sp. TaxID=35828 RepID=UPI003866D6E4
MSLFSMISKASVVALMASGLSFAGIADGASKFLGNTTTSGEIPDDFGTYWNQITAENECTWVIVEKTRGEYDWTGCNLVYNWAKENHATFSFHTLLWGSHYPVWLNSLDVDETKKAITDWFDAVQEHYPDLEMIEVVNEAVKSGDNYHSGFGRGNNFIEALGGNSGNYEFVTTAFKMARERWPKAILIYNDYNTIQWQKEQAIDLLKKIKAQGAPVDAFGMQFHETTTQGSGHYCLSASTLKRALHDAHEQTGLPIYITQYDVGDKDDEFQKKCYMEHIPLLMETEYVAGITLWGYVYGKTWISCNGTDFGCSGLIKDGVERSALTWLKEYFKDPGARRYGHGLATGATKSLGNVIVDGQTIPEDYDTYWNEITTDNACTWGAVEKERGKYDFSKCDAVYNWAVINRFESRVSFKFRNLLKGTHLPHWLNGLDVNETKEAVTAWFDEVAAHYPNIYQIEVVDGAVRNSTGHYHSGFEGNNLIEALGGDDGDYKFVATAFNMARKRWPYATLIYNDYDESRWENDPTVDLILKLQEQNAAIDAFGLQASNWMVQGSGPEIKCIAGSKIRDGIQKIYDKIKIPLFITEYYISTDSDSLQKACFAEHIPAFMESEYVAGVSLWSYIYGETPWMTPTNAGLIKNGENRPAMDWLEDYFKDHWLDAKSLWYTSDIPLNPVDTLGQGPDEPIAIGNKIRLEQNTQQSYDVFDVQGVRLGKLSAYGFSDAAKMLRASKATKASGIYFLRNHTTGKMQSVGIVR